jgi:hypothetical protein
MSSILYYSNFCQHSKTLLQNIGNSNVTKDVHFICIDKRVKEGNKLYIVLENGQKIVMPESVTKVPAILLLNDNYRVLYGEDILRFFKPKQEVALKQATQNNLEPMAFALGEGGSFGVTSDSYSFLDMDSDSLSAKGNGGVRQMHNYVSLNYSDTISTPQDEANYKGPKLPENLTVEQLMQQRDMDLKRK